MATQLDTSALQAILKQKYTQRRFNTVGYPRNAFLALVPKNTNFGGKNKVVALRYAPPLGRGTSIAAAQATKTASAYAAFVVTRAFDYAAATITGEAIRASRGDENSLIEGLSKEVDGAIYTNMRSAAIALFRNGGGARGQISTTAGSITGTTLTLSSPGDVTNFDYGMPVCFAADDGYNNGGALAGLRNGGATTLTVLGRDSDAGTLTLSGNVNSIPGTAQGDYIFFTAAGVGSDYASMIKGMGGWTPTTAPGATDNWFGVNRSQDVVRLAGSRITGGGKPMEETLIDAITRCVREGGAPDYAWCNYLDWAQIVKSLGTRAIYDRADAQGFDEPKIGFRAVLIDGPDGPVKLIADTSCPQGTFFVTTLNTWCLESLGDLPSILDDDGNTILRAPTSDAYEIRIGYYANLSCDAPGWNASGTF